MAKFGFCPFCGKPLPNGGLECPSCGKNWKKRIKRNQAVLPYVATNRRANSKGHTKYGKDITILVNKKDMEEMLEKCYLAQDAALLSLLYISGCRPIETKYMLGSDVYELAGDNEGEYVTLRIFTAKLGNKGGYQNKYRLNSIHKTTPFLNLLTDYAKTIPANQPLFPNTNSDRIRALVYKVSNKRFCPYHFRHSRFTKMAMQGVPLDTILKWKGGTDYKSVHFYIKAMPIGKGIKID